MDNVRRLASSLRSVSSRTRYLLVLVGGVVLGVLLVATGWAPAQLLGAVTVGAALLLARVGIAPAEEWLLDPWPRISSFWRSACRATPRWVLPVAIALGLLTGFGLTAAKVLTADDLDGGTLRDLGSGALAVALTASLGLWSGIPRFGRRRTAGAEASRAERAG